MYGVFYCLFCDLIILDGKPPLSGFFYKRRSVPRVKQHPSQLKLIIWKIIHKNNFKLSAIICLYTLFVHKNNIYTVEPLKAETFSRAWSKTLESVDATTAFKENGLTLKLDGSDDHLLKSSLRSLVGDEMFAWRAKMLGRKQAPPEGVKRKFLRQDGVPFDEVCIIYVGIN